MPRLITHVETTLATTDGQVTTPIHTALQTQDLLPADHIVDTAYLDAELLVTSQQEYGVNLVGPTRQDWGRHARTAMGLRHRLSHWIGKTNAPRVLREKRVNSGHPALIIAAIR